MPLKSGDEKSNPTPAPAASTPPAAPIPPDPIVDEEEGDDLPPTPPAPSATVAPAPSRDRGPASRTTGSVPAREKPPTLCRCMAHDPIAPGETVTRWGHTWTCEPDGVTLTALIPDYDVRNGVAAGRWLADGMDPGESKVLFLRNQYATTFGHQAAKDLTANQLQALLSAERKKRKGREAPDFIRSQ